MVLECLRTVHLCFHFFFFQFKMIMHCSNEQFSEPFEPYGCRMCHKWDSSRRAMAISKVHVALDFD